MELFDDWFFQRKGRSLSKVKKPRKLHEPTLGKVGEYTLLKLKGSELVIPKNEYELSAFRNSRDVNINVYKRNRQPMRLVLPPRFKKIEKQIHIHFRDESSVDFIIIEKVSERKKLVFNKIIKTSRRELDLYSSNNEKFG